MTYLLPSWTIHILIRCIFAGYTVAVSLFKTLHDNKAISLTNRRRLFQPKDLTSTLLQNNMPTMNMTGNTPRSTTPNQAIGQLPMAMAPTTYKTPIRPTNIAQPNYMPGMSLHSSVSNSSPFTNSIQSGPSWNASGPAKQTSSLDSLMSLPSQAKTPSLNSMQSSFGTQQYGVRPMSHGNSGHGSKNAFEMANPFMASTPPVNNSQTKPASNLSKQNLLDFLGWKRC